MEGRKEGGQANKQFVKEGETVTERKDVAHGKLPDQVKIVG